MTRAAYSFWTLALAGAVGLAAATREHARHVLKGLRDPYRPERHYMRGPGPKWHAKHDFGWHGEIA